MNKKISHNRPLAKKLGQCLNEASCFASSSVLADSLVLRNPLLSQVPKRTDFIIALMVAFIPAYPFSMLSVLVTVAFLIGYAVHLKLMG
jgi:hypothetical protein